jgi:DNA polymerase III epsilon subunit-like protein
LDENLFNTCLKKWLASDGVTPFWDDIRKEVNYPKSGENLRSEFKNERRRRKITKENYKNKHEFKTPYLPDNIKVIVFDVESSFMQVGVFQLSEQYIPADHILKESILICWSAKYLNESEIVHDCLTSEEALLNDDKRIVVSLHNLLNKSDVLIGHNIVSFDLRKINERFLYHSLPPIVKSQTIDTYLISKQNFLFASNSLKAINKHLGIKQKLDNEGFSLWVKSMNGNSDALRDILLYCDTDVLATENLFYKIRPFIKKCPNIALFYDTNEMRCPNCGSQVLSDEGFYYTSQNKYKSMRCECGALSRVKQSEIDSSKRKTLLVN